MNLPGFTADMAIYKSKRPYSMRGTLRDSNPSQVEPAAMYPGWQQMLPFIDPFWDWSWGGGGWRAGCAHPVPYNKCKADCASKICIYGDSGQMAACLERCYSNCKKEHC